MRFARIFAWLAALGIIFSAATRLEGA